MTTILAIDPGSNNARTSHTGIVLLDGTTLIDSWAVGSGVDGFRAWSSRCNVSRFDTGAVYSDARGKYFAVDVVVCEQFVDRNIMGSDRSPLLIEGAVRFLWPRVVLSPPSGYKNAVPDEILQRLGLWDFPGRDHHNDRRSAARHAVRYLKNSYDPGVMDVFK